MNTLLRQIALSMLLAGATPMLVHAAQPSIPVRSEAHVDASLAGHYRLDGIMEMGSELLLLHDGRFQWMSSYGALDQAALGRWHRAGDHVVLEADQPAQPPVFRLATGQEFGGAMPPVEAGWVVLVAVPAERAFGNIEVLFEGSGDVRETRVTDDNGVASLQPAPAGRWTRISLRRAGRNEAWQPIDLPPGRVPAHFAGVTVVDPARYRQAPFERMRLRVEGKDLVPSWPWDAGNEQGRYLRD